MNKQDRINELLAMDAEFDADSLDKMTAKEVKSSYEAVLAQQGEPEDAPEGEELAPIVGSKIRQKYRAKYAEQAKANGHVAKTIGGRATLNNGDELALLLESADPVQTCLVWDNMAGLSEGTTHAKYTTDRIGQKHPKTGEPLKALNDGMVRMNAGNRIRSTCKKVEDPATAIAEVRILLEEIQDTPAILKEQAA